MFGRGIISNLVGDMHVFLALQLDDIVAIQTHQNGSKVWHGHYDLEHSHKISYPANGVIKHFSVKSSNETEKVHSNHDVQSKLEFDRIVVAVCWNTRSCIQWSKFWWEQIIEFLAFLDVWKLNGEDGQEHCEVH